MKRGRHTIKEEEELFDDWFSEPNETPTPTITLPLIGKVQPEYILNKDNDDDMDEALHDQLRFLGSNERLVEEEEEEEELPELVDERTPIQEEEEEDNEDDHDSDMEDDHDEPQQGRKKNYLANPTSGPKEGWKRPSLDASTVSEDQDFILQHVETSYVVDGTEPVLRIWGCTKQGQSVLVQTRTFKPYFFVDVNNIEEMNQLVERMEAHLKQKNWKHHVVRHVLSVNPVKKRSMCGYHRNAPLRTMFKVTVAQPSYVATLRECLEKGNEAVTSRRISTFEGNLPFELRAMVDSNLSGCQWIKLKAGTFSIEHEQGGNVQYVIRPHHGLQGIHPIPISQMDDLAPMRYLSFDIETKRKKPGFCKAEEDPAVLICATLDVVGTGVVHKVVFAYVPNAHETVNPIEGATVYVFRKEKQMLLAFSQYIRESDPDAFTGWNITGFDWPYLFGRAKALDIFDEFVQFTRVAGKKAWMRSQVFKSKAYGAKKNNELLCEGRFDYDGLLFMLRGQMTKYRSYKLNAISKEVLNDQKVEVDYTQIPALHEGTDEDRTRLAFYCLKDSILPVELLNKLMAVINGIEQSRVTGVPIKWLLSRGQGVKTQSNMFRYKEACEVIPSRSPKSTGVYTAGGYVRDPLRGYYEHPLATLDFSSLYPSIMQAYNICYSTVESLAWAKANLKEGDYWIVPPLDGKGTPNDFVFVKKHIREGVLPKLLTALLAQRTYVKNLMKSVDQVTQKQYYNVLDGRQLALKVVCNSVYGFLKAFILTDSRLMAAVTAWGRTMIVNTAALVEDKYKDNMIVDRAACEALGLDYEQEPAPGVLIDPRPRKKYPARIIYGVSFNFLSFTFCLRKKKGH